MGKAGCLAGVRHNLERQGTSDHLHYARSASLVIFWPRASPEPGTPSVSKLYFFQEITSCRQVLLVAVCIFIIRSLEIALCLRPHPGLENGRFPGCTSRGR